MRKFLCAVILAGMLNIPANSTQIIQYNNAGGVINAPNQFGSNALFTPQNRARAAAKSRFIRHQNQFYNGLEKGRTVTVNVNSDKNSGKVKKDRRKRNFAKDKLKEENTEKTENIEKTEQKD